MKTPTDKEIEAHDTVFTEKPPMGEAVPYKKVPKKVPSPGNRKQRRAVEAKTRRGKK
jgi:hypothetical protein